MNKESKKKILFIHGYTQNSLVFQKRLKVLTKSLSNLFKVDFLFPDAPHIIDLDAKVESEEEIKRGWASVDKSIKMEGFFDLKEVEYLGINASIEAIKTIFEKNNDIECIFGFSQGSLIILFLLIMLQEGKLPESFKSLKCAVLASAFINPFPKNEDLQFIQDYVNGNKKINLPSLHIYGKTDDYLKPELSMQVIKIFENPQIFDHEGKHFIPSKKDDVEIITNYLKSFFEKL